MIAPYEGGRLRLPLWECRVEGAAPAGWGVFAVGTTARWLRFADPWERPRPTRRLVLLAPDDRGRWCGCAPGRRPGPCVRVGLVEGDLRFEEVLAVFDGSLHWFVESAGDALRAARLRDRLDAGEHPLDLPLSERPGDRLLYGRAWMARPTRDVGDRLATALAMASATLVGWRPAPGGYQVDWRARGETFTSLVGEDLRVRQAGFCLSGTDGWHDLTSLASLRCES